jgi:tRNA-2-methylthio-N6-dimethylallyladenosine synthase
MTGKRTAYIITYGCQMNLRDGEVAGDILSGAGFSLAPDPSSADVILVLTCAVREHASVRALGRIKDLSRHLRKNPHRLLAVGGCLAQTEAERIRREAPFVSLIFGTGQLPALPMLIEQALTAREAILATEMDENSFHLPSATGLRRDTVNGFVSIMRGCNNLCSYCIVPAARGPERYRPAPEIIAEAENLARDGFKQITLIGQNVNGWQDAGMTFAGLLRQVARQSGIPRLRFVTSHPKNLSDELIEVMVSEKNICPALHLPLQSGSDRILQAMGRGYTADEYLQLAGRLRKAIPDIALTTDLMVGFPGESKQDFSDTLQIISEAAFDGAFTFKYSPRQGTRAAEMVETLSEAEKVNRLQTLIAKTQEVGIRQNEKRLGKCYPALIEGADKHGGSLGRLESNHPVVIARKLPPRTLVRVTVTDITAWTLRGKLISPDSPEETSTLPTPMARAQNG